MSSKLTTQEFIYRARDIHGDKYGYAFSVYQSAHTKVSIHCPEHGVFEQQANNHLSGIGCPSCSGKKKHTCDSFIEKAREVHGDNYDYSLVRYVSVRQKVSISCLVHGVFTQKPKSHLSGNGCPGCANHGFDRTKKGFLYILRSDCGRHMKIGITHNPSRRNTKLKSDTPFSFKRIELIEGQGDQIADLEKELLSCYQPAEFTETFDGYTEWRLWSESVLNRIRYQCIR